MTNANTPKERVVLHQAGLNLLVEAAFLAELAAVHARWRSSVGTREYWILDDVSNPLVLRGSYNGSAFLDVVKLSFPTPEMTVAS